MHTKVSIRKSKNTVCNVLTGFSASLSAFQPPQRKTIDWTKRLKLNIIKSHGGERENTPSNEILSIRFSRMENGVKISLHSENSKENQAQNSRRTRCTTSYTIFREFDMVECSETVLRRCRMRNSLNWKIKRSKSAQIGCKGFGNFQRFLCLDFYRNPMAGMPWRWINAVDWF